MSDPRELSKEKIHAYAVALGRGRDFEGEAGRLAAADVGAHIDSLIARLRPVAWISDDATLIEHLGARLWLDWVTAEYRSAVRYGHTGAQRGRELIKEKVENPQHYACRNLLA